MQTREGSEYSRLGRTFHQLVEDRQKIRDIEKHAAIVQKIASRMASALLASRRIYWCGNGGSAAQAQHLAAEFSGRFLRERRGLPSEALSVNTSTLTAIGNDFGYEFIFSRQVESFVAPGDVVVLLTTSGKSRNLINAIEAAKQVGAITVAMSGNGGGPVSDRADLSIVGPNGYSAIVQEQHLILGHILCDLVEQQVMEAESTVKDE